MGVKFGNLKVVPNSAGIQSILKSSEMRQQMFSYGMQLAAELDEIAPSKHGWRVEVKERKDRLVINVTNDDLEVKWREVANGNIAKHMAAKKFRK